MPTLKLAKKRGKCSTKMLAKSWHFSRKTTQKQANKCQHQNIMLLFINNLMAEKVGFEPTEPRGVHLISCQMHHH